MGRVESPNGSLVNASDRARRRAERRYQIEVRRALTRNFSLHLMHGMLGQTGFRLLNAPTFLPAFVLMLSGGSEAIVGLALGLQSLGMAFTPLLSATMAEHRERVLPIALMSGLLMRLCILGMAGAAIWLEPAIALPVLLLFITLFGCFMGVQGVVFNFLMSKVIPVSKRGRLTGLRNFLAGIISAVVAYVGGTWLLGESPTADGYGFIFLLAFVLTMLGLSSLIFMREPVAPERRPAVSMLSRMRDVPGLLRSDPAFTRYVLARASTTFGRLAMPFYILFAGQSLTLSGENLAILTIAFTLAATVSNLLWGELADRRGFRLVFLLSVALWIAATIALLSSDGLLAAILVFIGIGAGNQGFMNAANNLTLEFGNREDLPLRIALANTCAELAGAVGPVLGGLIAASFGYPATFATSIAFLALGGLAVLRFVPEPRYQA